MIVLRAKLKLHQLTPTGNGRTLKRICWWTLSCEDRQKNCCWATLTSRCTIWSVVTWLSSAAQQLLYCMYSQRIYFWSIAWFHFIWQHEEPRIHAHIDQPKDVNMLFYFLACAHPCSRTGHQIQERLRCLVREVIRMQVNKTAFKSLHIVFGMHCCCWAQFLFW